MYLPKVSQVYRRMEQNERHDDKQKPEYHPLSVDGRTFIFDPISKIYKAEASEKGDNRGSGKYEVSPFIPIGVRIQRDWLGFIVSTIIGLGTFIIVARYTYYAGGQWLEMRRAADASAQASQTASCALQQSQTQFRDTLGQMKAQTSAQERQFTIEERPYITLENIRFDPLIDQNHIPATVKFDFHNAGRTPALKATFTNDTFIDDKKVAETPRDFNGEMTIASDRNVGGSESIWIRGTGDFDGIVGGTRKLSIKGTVIYTDIFKEWHLTDFCAIYDALVTKNWVYCPGNNVR